MAELLKLNREGMSILIVTHDSKVASTCDRIMYLLDGRIRGGAEARQAGKQYGKAAGGKGKQMADGYGVVNLDKRNIA